ncbi:MAG: hypothetical protein HFI66_09030 [Lachnospiraceae bacterium]|jgi:hypothetical protein|nr:hypothetical protein [Lachnospiraceae bacterium]
MKLANNKKKSDMPYKMEPLVPIPSYAPHDTLTAKGYEIPSVLIKFEENFELRCREIIKNGKLDQYNKGYMDGLICCIEKQALAELEVQRAAHNQRMADLSRLRAGDRIKAEEKLRQVEKEIQTVKEELEKIEAVYGTVKGE